MKYPSIEGLSNSWPSIEIRIEDNVAVKVDKHGTPLNKAHWSFGDYMPEKWSKMNAQQRRWFLKSFFDEAIEALVAPPCEMHALDNTIIKVEWAEDGRVVAYTGLNDDSPYASDEPISEEDWAKYKDQLDRQDFARVSEREWVRS